MTAVTTELVTGLTTWERWKGGYPARNTEERERYAGYDGHLTRLGEIRREAELRAAVRRAVLVPGRERS